MDIGLRKRTLNFTPKPSTTVSGTSPRIRRASGSPYSSEVLVGWKTTYHKFRILIGPAGSNAFHCSALSPSTCTFLIFAANIYVCIPTVANYSTGTTKKDI